MCDPFFCRPSFLIPHSSHSSPILPPFSLDLLLSALPPYSSHGHYSPHPSISSFRYVHGFAIESSVAENTEIVDSSLFIHLSLHSADAENHIN